MQPLNDTIRGFWHSELSKRHLPKLSGLRSVFKGHSPRALGLPRISRRHNMGAWALQGLSLRHPPKGSSERFGTIFQNGFKMVQNRAKGHWKRGAAGIFPFNQPFREEAGRRNHFFPSTNPSERFGLFNQPLRGVRPLQPTPPKVFGAARASE